MPYFEIKTHRPEITYKKAHFFILNKGLNSGKPLKEPCPNCFVCIVQQETDKDFMYWLCYGLWKSNSFHQLLKGSVIPFMTIGELKKHLLFCDKIASNDLETFKKSVQTLKLLEVHEEKIKTSLKLIETAKKVIFYKLMNNSSAT